MNVIEKLHSLGQSLWYDNIQRGALENGELAGMIQRGEIRGVTSNPTIFQNAIAKSKDYDDALKPMAWAGWQAEEIFYQLAIEDIRAAADLFRPLFDATDGADGYVSLEVNPKLAGETEATISEAQRLWNWVDRPNLMVKIPATLAGIPAIRQSIAAGINVNITLIFSLARYAMVMDAFMSGLEDRLASGKPVDRIASVASFFVSRVDSKVDPQLEEMIRKEGPESEKAARLSGKIAIANSRLAYELFEQNFSSERWRQLEARGARIQRPLWASTSTKNSAYRDVLYVEELVAPNTVNTVPPQTLALFFEHGEPDQRMKGKEEDARQAIKELESLGISMEQVTRELEEEGVDAFARSFESLLSTIDESRKAYLAELGQVKELAAEQVSRLAAEQMPRRLFDHDPTLWTDDPAGQAEIRKRMGWLEAPYNVQSMVSELEAFVEDVYRDGFTHALLLGMGGSSLAPEVMALTFSGANKPQKGLALTILDSTDPDQVSAAALRSPAENTLYIVSSKSGSTSEVNAFLDYFWDLAQRATSGNAGHHFIAITDPSTELDRLARERSFRRVFNADPSVGGRNSALTAFGIVPAALIGLDLQLFLTRTIKMADQCGPEVPAGRNPGIVLGAVLGTAAVHGKDKLTILTDPEIDSFGSWLEQLVAESSGKQGKGIVPIDLEPLMEPSGYSQDRIFVYVRQSGSLDDHVKALHTAGHPALVLNFSDNYELGAEFYRWEIAVATACSVLGVNSFDQPDVQDNKTRTARKIKICQETGRLEDGEPIWQGESGLVFGEHFDGLAHARSLSDVVASFISVAQPGDYIAINAYLPRNRKILEQLQELRRQIQQKTGLPTTLGFGPRFLHSTGQLHKGGPDTGLFLQITDEESSDFEIPNEGISFGSLERAQALGDLEALLARGRRAIRLHIKEDEIGSLIP